VSVSRDCTRFDTLDAIIIFRVDGLVYEFKGKHVVRKEGDIVLAGSNPSAEGEDADDGSDENVERGIDFVLNHRLQEMKCYGRTKVPFAYSTIANCSRFRGLCYVQVIHQGVRQEGG
jgi:hypothetical protein